VPGCGVPSRPVIDVVSAGIMPPADTRRSAAAHAVVSIRVPHSNRE